MLLYLLGFGLLGYLSGSLPFSIWITRLVKGVDVRDSGSGHATTTNTLRQAGFGPGALVFILDVAKGFIPVWLAWHYGSVYRTITLHRFGLHPSLPPASSLDIAGRPSHNFAAGWDWLARAADY